MLASTGRKKQLGNVASVGGWMDNDVTLSLYTLAIKEKKRMAIGKAKEMPFPRKDISLEPLNSRQ